MSGYSRPRPLSESDDVGIFDGGELSLDDYLRTRALANHAGGASRCFVTCQGGSRRRLLRTRVRGSVIRRLTAPKRKALRRTRLIVLRR